MTKEVLVTISGLHFDTFSETPDEENEPIEVITPATYYLKNDKHYIFYEELVEGIPGSIKNRIQIEESGKMEMIKSGISNTHMTFEKEKIHMTQYDTPYGELMLGIYTKDMKINVQEENIDVEISYALDANGEKVADCSIVIKIKANGKEKDRSAL